MRKQLKKSWKGLSMGYCLWDISGFVGGAEDCCVLCKYHTALQNGHMAFKLSITLTKFSLKTLLQASCSRAPHGPSPAESSLSATPILATLGKSPDFLGPLAQLSGKNMALHDAPKSPKINEQDTHYFTTQARPHSGCQGQHVQAFHPGPLPADRGIPPLQRSPRREATTCAEGTGGQ